MAMSATSLVRGNIERAGLLVWSVGTALIGLKELFPGDRFIRRRVVDAFTDTILRPLPIVTVLSALIGLVIAFGVSRALDFAHFEPPLLSGLREALTREVVPILVGIFVAGRSGVELCVRIGRMIASGEAETLRIIGVTPSSYILPASFIAFVAAGFGLTLWGIGVAHLSSALLLQSLQGIPVARYVEMFSEPAATRDIWYGVLRAEVYAILTFAMAAVEGSGTTSDPRSLEKATRATFVYALLLILGTAAIMSGLGA